MCNCAQCFRKHETIVMSTKTLQKLAREECKSMKIWANERKRGAVATKQRRRFPRNKFRLNLNKVYARLAVCAERLLLFMDLFVELSVKFAVLLLHENVDSFCLIDYATLSNTEPCSIEFAVCSTQQRVSIKRMQRPKYQLTVESSCWRGEKLHGSPQMYGSVMDATGKLATECFFLYEWSLFQSKVSCKVCRSRLTRHWWLRTNEETMISVCGN